jgi:hypothetical protein
MLFFLFLYNGYMHLVSPYWYVRVCTGIFANLLFANLAHLFRNSLNVHKILYFNIIYFKYVLFRKFIPM